MDRRKFLSTGIKTGVALTLGTGLLNLSGCYKEKSKRPLQSLIKDPIGICDLPSGFEYRILSTAGETMNDGRMTPGYQDGMGYFKAPKGGHILVCNHEVPVGVVSNLTSSEQKLAYDVEASGGTSTLWLNDKLEVTQHYLSLAGTIRNCAGGVTPWGSWLSSEEPGTEGWMLGKRHGYNFEVDSKSQLELARPLKAMGRFNHEAVAVDPDSGIAYQTEDNPKGCFYRFIPNKLEHFEEGGTLQALKFVNADIKDTSKQSLGINEPHLCEWVTVDEADPEQNTVHLQAQEKGAAVFVRGEGIIKDLDGIYFACTTGGKQGMGQIFKYRPGQDTNKGTIELVYEAGMDDVLQNPDNLTLNSWGDLIICEDNGMDKQHIVGLTPEGKFYYIAGNNKSEWTGACFSDDGKTLFANIQKKPGMTLAIQGPWESLRQNI